MSDKKTRPSVSVWVQQFPGDRKGNFDFGETQIGQENRGMLLGWGTNTPDLQPGVSTYTVHVTGPFYIQGVDGQTYTVKVQERNASHLGIAFRPDKPGRVTGILKITSDDSEVKTENFSNPQQLVGTGVGTKR